jgi:hypothetical protein
LRTLAPAGVNRSAGPNIVLVEINDASAAIKN